MFSTAYRGFRLLSIGRVVCCEISDRILDAGQQVLEHLRVREHVGTVAEAGVEDATLTLTPNPAHWKVQVLFLASVTVIDALAVRADAFDTALMVLGPDEGMALATRLDLAALFIERTGNGFSERATPRFEEIAAKR